MTYSNNDQTTTVHSKRYEYLLVVYVRRFDEHVEHVIGLFKIVNCENQNLLNTYIG